MAENMKKMNPKLKVIFCVCDNVRRTLSRYLHLKALAQASIEKGKDEYPLLAQRFDIIGNTTQIFEAKLNVTIDQMTHHFQDIGVRCPYQFLRQHPYLTPL